MSLTISTDAVHEIVQYCLFKEEEMNDDATIKDEASATIVEGIVQTFGFHTGRLEEKREDVKTLLSQLGDEYKEGYSFLSLCVDRNNNQWTSYQEVMEVLVCLGIGLGYASMPIPKLFWPMLPGGMPYVQTNLD